MRMWNWWYRLGLAVILQLRRYLIRDHHVQSTSHHKLHGTPLNNHPSFNKDVIPIRVKLLAPRQSMIPIRAAIIDVLRVRGDIIRSRADLVVVLPLSISTMSKPQPPCHSYPGARIGKRETNIIAQMNPRTPRIANPPTTPRIHEEDPAETTDVVDAFLDAARGGPIPGLREDGEAV